MGALSQWGTDRPDILSFHSSGIKLMVLFILLLTLRKPLYPFIPESGLNVIALMLNYQV